MQPHNLGAASCCEHLVSVAVAASSEEGASALRADQLGPGRAGEAEQDYLGRRDRTWTSVQTEADKLFVAQDSNFRKSHSRH